MARLDFGLQIEPQYGFSYEGIRGIAVEAERLGFESLWVSDHFFLTPELADTPCLECWTTIAALARDTKRLRLGAMVSSQSYRNPALAAKMAASVDNVSGGRLNFGVGAGWKEAEYGAYGYPFPSPDTRIRQLNDALEIAKRMWTEERATYAGRYYSVKDAICAPKPVQRPHPPIWIGGTGSFTLRIAARHADAVNFAWTIPVPKFREKLEEFRGYCEARGRDYEGIRKSAGLMITMAEDEDALAAKLREREARSDTPYMRYLAKQPANLVGTTDQVAARIREYMGLGVDHFILRFHFGEEIEGLRLFTEKVRPLL
ncbi:MAG: TIGR03560 family F420-dependent LLM class oxidoreductase [Candidatus Bathyarchaeia archaeon]